MVPAAAQIAPFDDYSHAPAYYHDKAKAGNADAQFLLGLALEKLGPAAESRWGAAESWIAEAAAAGLPEAQLRLGQIRLAAGDAASARQNLEAAAAAGIPEAQFNLGALAEQSGRPADARRSYRQAARQGYAPAQFNLALSLIEVGGEAALTDALSWLILAAEQGAASAAAARDQVKAVLNKGAITAAEKRADARR
jgi:TPR repeat protein